MTSAKVKARLAALQRYVAAHPGVSTVEVQAAFSAPPAATARDLKKLATDGVLRVTKRAGVLTWSIPTPHGLADLYTPDVSRLKVTAVHRHYASDKHPQKNPPRRREIGCGSSLSGVAYGLSLESVGGRKRGTS